VPDTFDRLRDRPGTVPDTFDRLRDRPGTVPDTFDRLPDRPGIMPDAFDRLPDRPGTVPDAFDRLPDRPGIMPEPLRSTCWGSLIGRSLARHIEAPGFGLVSKLPELLSKVPSWGVWGGALHI
jgi:hypothetical protein